MIRPLLAVCALLIATTSSAQIDPLKPMPVGDILLSLPSSHIPDEGTWEVRFMHRFNQSIDEGDAFDNLFGLDSGANVVLGGSYVITPRIQASLLRSNVNDTWEPSGKFVIFQQAPALPLTATLRAGASIRTEEAVQDKTSWFAQAILSREFGGRLGIYVLPTFVTEAGQQIDGALFEHAFNIPIGINYMFRPGYSVTAEIYPVNRDLPDDIDADIGWALGIKRAIGGHYFEILLTNNNATMVDQYVTSTYQGGGLSTGDIQLGFNIERRFGRKR